MSSRTETACPGELPLLHNLYVSLPAHFRHVVSLSVLPQRTCDSQHAIACLQDALNARLQQKEQMRNDLREQLAKQSKTFSSVERDAQALLLKALHAGRKVTVSS